MGFFACIAVTFLVLGGVLNIFLGLAVAFLIASVFFIVLIHMPKIECNNVASRIDREMVKISRQFLIDIQSGLSIFSAYEDLAKSGTYTARFFDEVISKIYLGVPVEEAIRESIELNPSKNFRKMQNQILSALLTGSDVETVFKVTLEELIKGFIIIIKDYSKKLGAIAMIYMIFGTVLPAIGSVLVVLVLSIAIPDISPQFFMILYIVLLVGLLLIQGVFINMFKSIKPNVEF